MAEQLICQADTVINVESKADTLYIGFIPIGAALPKKTYVKLKVSPFTQKNGFRIRVPGVLQSAYAKESKERRFDITFKASFGNSSSWQAFIFRELAKQTSEWHLFQDAYTWFANVKDWKKRVIQAWQNLKLRNSSMCISKPCKRPRSPNVLASIPVNFCGTCFSITLHRQADIRLCVRLPTQLAGPHSQNEIALACGNPGEMPKFVKFVADYIRTAVLNFATIECAKSWAKELPSFAKLVIAVWRDFIKHPFWAIRPSKVVPPKDMEHLPRGSGLFCTKKGKHLIFFGDEPLSCWIKRHVENDSVEARYAIGGKQRDGYTYFLPTNQSFKTGVIHPGFKVCHSATPTHILRFNAMGNFYWLQPKNGQITNPDDEFTFDYHLKDVFAAKPRV